MKEYLQTVQDIKGIIQIGANSGQEVPLFETLTQNIILCEPIETLHQHLRLSYPKYLVVPYALGNLDAEMEFYPATNGGESSSLLKPTKHIEYYPSIGFENPITVPVRKFTTLSQEFKIDIQKYNVIVSDAQGYDLEALKGFGEYINHFKMIIVEYINSDLYENNSTLPMLIEYLSTFGYRLLSTFDENIGAGNAVFIK